MRERLRLYGGTLDTGTDEDGSFRVRVSIPLARTRRVIKLLIADDHALARGGLRGIFAAEPEFEVVGEAADGARGGRAGPALRPDVVLMDIRMPRLDGIEATRRLQAHASRPRVLVLTTFDLDEYVYEALRAGASGFMLKDAPPSQLREAVRTVAAGESLLAPAVTRRLVERFVQPPRTDAGAAEAARRS